MRCTSSYSILNRWEKLTSRGTNSPPILIEFEPNMRNDPYPSSCTSPCHSKINIILMWQWKNVIEHENFQQTLLKNHKQHALTVAQHQELLEVS